MFFRDFFKRRRDTPDMRRHRAEVAVLRESLIDNIFQDAFYETFPEPGHGTKKVHFDAPPYNVKFITSIAPHRTTVSAVVRKKEDFIGSVMFNLKDWHIVHTLPDDRQSRAGLAALMHALITIDAHDTSARQMRHS